MAFRVASRPAEHKDSARAARSVSEGHAGSLKHHNQVALVCDWLTTPGGAEKVLLELHRLYPDAPIYTSQYRKKGINWFNDATVKTGWLQIFPAFLRKFLGPLRQIYFSHLNLSAYDLVISVTGAEAKSVRTTPKSKKKHSKNHFLSETALFDKKSSSSLEVGHLSDRKGSTHLCYCHVPTQYYWQFYDRYVDNPGFGILNPLVRFFFKLFVKPLRKADLKAAKKPTEFITISSYAADQIQKYYHRKATVIAPPVDLKTFSTANPPQTAVFSTISTTFSTKTSQKSTTTPDLSTVQAELSTRNPQEIHKKSTKSAKFSTSFPQDFHRHFDDGQQGKTTKNQPYFIISCRQVTWKRADLAIEACLQTNSPLLVVGDGPEHQRLKKLANGSPLIKFLPWTPAAELAQYLAGAAAYLFPSCEPFGIAAVEALAAGCPVIAYQDGGSTDFVKSGENGLTFPEQTAKSLAKAIKKFQNLHFDRQTIRKSAEKFSTKHFDEKITRKVNQALNRESNHAKI